MAGTVTSTKDAIEMHLIINTRPADPTMRALWGEMGWRWDVLQLGNNSYGLVSLSKFVCQVIWRVACGTVCFVMRSLSVIQARLGPYPGQRQGVCFFFTDHLVPGRRLSERRKTVRSGVPMRESYNVRNGKDSGRKRHFVPTFGRLRGMETNNIKAR